MRDVVDVEPLADKLRAFQFHVLEVDGHDVGAIAHALALAKAHVDGPTCLIAHTIKGKGYAPAQGQRHCHLIPVSEADCLAACAYIDAQG